MAGIKEDLTQSAGSGLPQGMRPSERAAAQRWQSARPRPPRQQHQAGPRAPRREGRGHSTALARWRLPALLLVRLLCNQGRDLVLLLLLLLQQPAQERTGSWAHPRRRRHRPATAPRSDDAWRSRAPSAATGDRSRPPEQNSCRSTPPHRRPRHGARSHGGELRPPTARAPPPLPRGRAAERSEPRLRELCPKPQE